MIEIKCTEEQKEIIIDAFCKADVCSSIGMMSEVSSDDCATIACGECYEQNIKWDIQPEPLKPCPCCGGEAAYGGLGYYKSVYCTKCHLNTIRCEAEKQAAEIWNRRTTS